MTFQTVTVTWSEVGPTGAPASGSVTFQLTAPLIDSSGEVAETLRQPYFFTAGTGTSDALVANDSSGATPSGTAYRITVALTGQQARTFISQVMHANGSSQTLGYLEANAAVPAVQYAQYLPLTTGTPAAGEVPAFTGTGYATTPALALAQQATTGTAGYALVNGTGSIISWAVPGDGLLHRFAVFGELIAASAAGGQVNVSFTGPDGSGQNRDLIDSFTTGFYDLYAHGLWACQAGTTVTVQQHSAMSGGTAKLWAEIWGA